MMVVYEKSYPLRHIGHLDLMRTMQRALRRSRLPVHYSRGFNPHIKLSFASPLSVGIVGEREIMDVHMDGECVTGAFAEALGRVMPNGLKIISAQAISDAFPTLMGLAAGSRYRIETESPPDALAAAVQQLLALDEYTALRKTKSGEAMCDIRPFIDTLELKDGAIRFTARNLQSGSLKPSVVMNALFSLSDIEPCDYTVIREAILAKDAQGDFVPLEVISFA